jgi:flavin-dependent dehydrogenase
MRAEVAVVGGGLAGASFAALTAAAGRDVLLIERETGPHDKVCGEFLSREAQLYLRALGIDVPALGAVPISTLGFALGRRAVSVPLPFTGLSLSRRVLDEAVLTRAKRSGARVLRGQRATGIADGAVRLEDGAAVDARTIVLATGKHDLRGHGRPAGRQNDLIGFKMLFRLTPAETAGLAGRIELTLFPGGYAGLQPVEEGRANLCLLIRRDRFADLGRSWSGLLERLGTEAPSLAARLAGGVPEWDKPLTIAGLPYGLVLRETDGLWRLGDQAAVIPSFSGDGMSIALHSAFRAATAYLNGDTSAVFQRRLAADLGAQVGRATLLSRLGVRTYPQYLLMSAAKLWPAALRLGATATRVPDAAVRAAVDDAALIRHGPTATRRRSPW